MKNYMIDKPTEEDLNAAERLCNDERAYSDGSRLSNEEKWRYATAILEREKPTLFTPISYEDVYEEDDPVKCLAASYVADLRLQFLTSRLSKNPADMVAHSLYMYNTTWHAKLSKRTQIGTGRDTVLT